MAKKKKQTSNQLEIQNAAKTLYANIRFMSVDDPIRSIVMTSSVPNEGKSTASMNLAQAIATSGKRVLLVEADMRRRSLAAMLGVRAPAGAYSVLTDAVTLNAAVVATNTPNMYFLDAEPNIPSPADILSTKRFASLVDKLRDSFDYVIFDTPPVSLFVDAAILSSLVDGTLLVIRQNQTKRSLVAKCAQQLRVADARILGTVMTFCTDDESSYYYAYYTQDGKRVNKEDLEPAAMPSDLNNPVAWEQEGHTSPRRASSGRSAAQPRPGMADVQGAVAGGNPYAPNAFKAMTPGSKTPRHKNRTRS